LVKEGGVRKLVWPKGIASWMEMMSGSGYNYCGVIPMDEHKKTDSGARIPSDIRLWFIGWVITGLMFFFLRLVLRSVSR